MAKHLLNSLASSEPKVALARQERQQKIYDDNVEFFRVPNYTIADLRHRYLASESTFLDYAKQRRRGPSTVRSEQLQRIEQVLSFNKERFSDFKDREIAIQDAYAVLYAVKSEIEQERNLFSSSLKKVCTEIMSDLQNNYGSALPKRFITDEQGMIGIANRLKLKGRSEPESTSVPKIKPRTRY